MIVIQLYSFSIFLVQSLALVCTEVEELLSLRCQPSPFVSITKDAMEMF